MPTANIEHRLLRLLRIVVRGLSAGLILLFIVSGLLRLHYPFPLEQLEGSMALGVARVAHGLPLYARPDFTFIAYMYSPAYFYVAGCVARLLGTGLFSLRLVSFLSTLGCFVVIAALIFTDTKSRFAALAGAGLYAAAYPVTQHWFDLGRVDSLYVLLVLLALFATRRLHPVLAALVWTLAFLAKQTIAPVALIVLCWNAKQADSKGWRSAIAGCGAFVLFSSASMAWLDRVTHGWFGYYVFTVPHANSDLRLHAAAFFPSFVVLAPFGVAVVVIAAALLFTHIHWKGSPARFYLLAGGSTLTLCWFLNAHAGATANTAMPLYAILAVGFGIALARLLGWLSALAPSHVHTGEIVLLLAVAAQLASQLYSPKLTAPLPELHTSQQQFVNWLRLFPGEVLIPAHPYEAMLAGKLAHPDEAAIHDALRPGWASVDRPLVNEIQRAIDTESLDAIVLDRSPQEETEAAPWLPADWRTHYPVLGLVPGSDQVNPFSPGPRYVALPCRALGWPAAQALDLIQIPLPSGPPPCPGMHPR